MKYAFPYNPKPFVGDGTQWAQDVDSDCVGMTLREYYAGLAMQAMIGVAEKDDSWHRLLAPVAFKIADAMVEEASK